MNENIKSSTEFNLVNFYFLLKKRRKFIIIFIISCLILTFFYSLISPYHYTAEATVLPPDKENGGSGAVAQMLQGLSNNYSMGGIGKSSKTQVFTEILISKENAKYIVKKLDLINKFKFKSDNLDALYSIVIASYNVDINHNQLIFVTSNTSTGWFPSSKDKDMARQLAADIANTSIEGLDSINRFKSISSAKNVGKYIEKMLAIKKHELDSVQNYLEIFQRNNKILDLETQAGSTLKEAIASGAEYAKSDLELKLLQQELKSTSPIIQFQTHKVDELRKQYNKIQEGGIINNNNISIPLHQVPSLTRIYTNLIRDEKILQEVTSFLETQKFEEAIQEARDLPTVEVLDKAVPPPTHQSPNKKVMLVLCFVISSLLSIIMVVSYAFIYGGYYLKKEEKLKPVE